MGGELIEFIRERRRSDMERDGRHRMEVLATRCRPVHYEWRIA